LPTSDCNRPSENINSNELKQNKGDQQTTLNDTSSPHSFYTTKNSSSSVNTTLLATAMVKISFANGHKMMARALLDSGSSCTIINEQLANQLAVKRNFSQKVSHLNGISSVPIQTKGMTNINLFSMNDDLIAENHNVLILNKITSDLPCTEISPEVMEKLKHFKLADTSFHKPGPIQVLIGADLFLSIIKENKYSLGKNMPYAIDSSLGFVIMGQVPIANTSENANSCSMTSLLTLSEDPLHKLMTKFWESEQPPTIKAVNPSDIECENHFKNTFKRDEHGKYTVSLPFKDDPATELGQSSEIAKKRFLSLEKKLHSQPEYKSLYCDFMKDYAESGHMKLFDINNHTSFLSTPHYFIPHHGVFKKNSSANKIRVVFNASTLTSSGKSLNDLLHSGPKLHNDISSIIVNFRRYKYVFSTDIKQMFRSINLNEEDHNYQMIYWREDPSLPLNVWKLQTLTYGMKSSPFLANRSISQLIKDEGSKHPIASSVLQDQIYVDDILLGADTLEEVTILQNDVNELLHKGGFNLRKWTANHEDLLKNIPKEFHETTIDFNASDQPLISILGLQWLPNKDCFSYRIKTTENIVHTKRSVLQNISSIYDPCGFLAPVVFFAKEFIQQLWLSGLTWDTPLPDELGKTWNNFLLDLPKLEMITFDRSLLISNAVDIQLHGFSDSSPKGMAACVYVRTTSSNGEVNIRLIIAKTRVAPLKHTSLPRLELCAAYLLSDLLDFCIKQLETKCVINSIYAWSDSSVTLYWIKTPSYRLKVYIANRVSHIQEITSPEVWRYVPSSQNPIDCATRGLYPSELLANTSWFNGPLWLYSSIDKWPKSTPVINEKDIPEMNKSSSNTCITATENKDWNLLNSFSSWTKLTRVLSYVLRFVNNARTTNKITGHLTSDELLKAEKYVIRTVQQEHFHEDIESLKKDKTCSHRLQRLAPFIDADGLLRVGGRLTHAPLHYSVKHPLILPKSSHITNIIIDYFHLKHLHAGPLLLQSILSMKYWILSARSVIRSRIFKCLVCYRYRPVMSQPKMGNLPESRLIPSPAFKITGCDYAGPFDIKIHTLRRSQTIKGYICLFVCFVSKAVHVEVTTDLTSDSYLAALTRFVSRRGLSSDIYLDNGTNFVGASNHIKKTLKVLMNDPEMKEKINKFSLENSVKFHFNPPTASHMGGLWERAVRSMKSHLYKVVGQQILTLEEFQTLTIRIEAMLNSRPLCPLSSDPSDIEVLTPGHFLIGRALTTLPEIDHSEIPNNRLKRWQMVQSMTQQVWKRWQKEVLYHLQERSKWTKQQDNLQVGDLVIIHEDNVPSLTWKMGRVTGVSPGQDGIVRVVHLKTASTTLTRPAVKVSRLPVN